MTRNAPTGATKSGNGAGKAPRELLGHGNGTRRERRRRKGPGNGSNPVLGGKRSPETAGKCLESCCPIGRERARTSVSGRKETAVSARKEARKEPKPRFRAEGKIHVAVSGRNVRFGRGSASRRSPDLAPFVGGCPSAPSLAHALHARGSRSCPPCMRLRLVESLQAAASVCMHAATLSPLLQA